MKNLPKRPTSALPPIARLLKNDTVQKLLKPLENSTKDKKMISDGAKVVVTNELTTNLLKDFFENRVLAIHVPGYCKADIAEKTSNNILQKELHNWNIRDVKEGYKNTDVEVFGQPFTTASRDEESWTRYFTEAHNLAKDLRNLSAPEQYPLDKFRNEMDELWPEGMITGIYKGHKMVPGLVRVMHEKKNVVADNNSYGCHVDDTPIISDKKGKFSVNIYLKPAPMGGNLLVWDTKMTSIKDFFSKWYISKNFFLESNYQNQEIQKEFQSILPKPQEIKVSQGDLVLINTSRPHAVTNYSGGTRVSIQAFITYKKGKPLQVWA